MSTVVHSDASGTNAVQPNGSTAAFPHSAKGTPAWEVAFLFPQQGGWTEDDYFALDTKRLVELSNGFLEVLPIPTRFHQSIALFLYRQLHAFLISWGNGGQACAAPVPIRLWQDKVREPDVFYIAKDHLGDPRKRTEKIDLAMEVVSGGSQDRKRDYDEKVVDYAKAGIPEYWIVDPDEKKITVLTLAGDAYREHGVFTPGMKATSVLLPGFEIDVEECLNGGEPSPSDAKN